MKKKFTEKDTIELYGRMDVGQKVAEVMNRRDIKIPHIAKAAKISVRRVRNILGGEVNLTIHEMVHLFGVMGCRFDLVVTLISHDEWDTKRQIETLESKLWKLKERNEPRPCEDLFDNVDLRQLRSMEARDCKRSRAIKKPVEK